MSKNWPIYDAKIGTYLSDLSEVVRHLNEITNYSSANRERFQKNLSTRHLAIPEPEEPGRFPLCYLPHRKNARFYGRETELAKINESLDWKNPNTNPLRTYTIYGRRGVGKTQLALEYAYSNPAEFEAIFWIQCETILALRQSFTNMAIQLCLPGADKHGMRLALSASSSPANMSRSS